MMQNDLTLSQRTEELYRIPNREPNAEGLIEAALLPLRDLVVFPRMVSPIFVGREASLLAVREAQAKEQTVIGLTQEDPDLNDPNAEDFLPVGVEMAVGRMLQMPDGSYSALVQGRKRVEIVEFLRVKPYIKVRARVINETQTADRQTQALMRSVLSLFERCVQLDRSIPEEAYLFAMNIAEPGWLCDMIATSLSLTYEAKLRLLLVLDPRARLGLLNNLLAQEVDVLELEDEIHSRVQSEVDKSQREFYLREQMKQIQNELGEGDIFTRDATDLKTKVEAANLHAEARAVALKELDRLNQIVVHDAARNTVKLAVVRLQDRANRDFVAFYRARDQIGLLAPRENIQAVAHVSSLLQTFYVYPPLDAHAQKRLPAAALFSPGEEDFLRRATR